MNDYNELIERCKEICAWQDTGLLKGDALRNFAASRPYAQQHNSFSIAQAETLREVADAFIASVDRIDELESRLEISPLHNVDGIMARDATIKLQDEYIAKLESERAERERQEPVAWEGAEQWEPLAMFLCADENGSDSCHEMVWEGYPPEPWGERWQKYESEARRMIDLTRYAFQTVTAPVRLTDEDFARLYDEAGFDPNEMREAAEHMFNAVQSAVLRANGFKLEG